MSPDRILELSVAAVFGAFALMMLVMAGPIAVVVWFIVSLPVLWAVVIAIASRCREIREDEWKEREWQWKQWQREAEYWKSRALRAEGAAGLWKAMAGGAGRGSAGSLAALAMACGSRRSLIALLHPDRHRNSRAANSATAYVMQHLPK